MANFESLKDETVGEGQSPFVKAVARHIANAMSVEFDLDANGVGVVRGHCAGTQTHQFGRR